MSDNASTRPDLVTIRQRVAAMDDYLARATDRDDFGTPLGDMFAEVESEMERLCDGIRKLHAPVLNVGADTTVTHLCGRCADEDGVLLAWPCPTAALLDDRTETT